MNTYATVSGRRVRVVTEKGQPENSIPPPKPLTPEELAEAVAARDFVRKHMPDMLPLIESLVSLRLIDGWRNVVSFELTQSEKK